ncbi:MAG: biotin--[acetyl-CoA-carboxylase] ligase [Rikenellaceae bacterium]
MINIIYNDSVSSTNDLAAACNEPWSVFIAEQQTKGRGQRGNTWESEPKKNLTFSITLMPEFLTASQQFYLSKIVSLAVVYTLEDIDINAKIKWPNDIYVDDKKICGILIENSITTQGTILKCIAGVGINVNQTEFKSSAPNPISIINILGEEQNRNTLLNDFALHLLKLYNFLAVEERALIDTEYINYLYRHNETHTYKDKSGVFSGKIIAVHPQGELIVEKDSSTRESYLFKEIEFII